jgi:hypothetical protein
MNPQARTFCIFGILIFLSCMMTAVVHGAESTATVASTCTEAPPVKAKAKERFDLVTFMTVARILESQSESNFHLKYSNPSSHCIVETFSVDGTSISAGYSAWEKGLSTLVYRFSVSRSSGNSEILLLYSGMASLTAGDGLVFHLSEERQGVISWYAMFRDEPAFVDVKALVEKIVRGDAKPLLAVTWRKGAKEGEIVAFDDSRLK